MPLCELSAYDRIFPCMPNWPFDQRGSYDSYGQSWVHWARATSATWYCTLLKRSNALLWIISCGSNMLICIETIQIILFIIIISIIYSVVFFCFQFFSHWFGGISVQSRLIFIWIKFQIYYYFFLSWQFNCSLNGPTLLKQSFRKVNALTCIFSYIYLLKYLEFIFFFLCM